MRHFVISSVAAGLAACAAESNKAASADVNTDVKGEIIATGVIDGRSGHKMSGGVEIRKADDGYYVVLGEDFLLDGAPAPRLGFGNSNYAKETQFSDLLQNEGLQSYKLPANIDPAEFSTFYVWCARFSVPLGVAELKPAA